MDGRRRLSRHGRPWCDWEDDYLRRNGAGGNVKAMAFMLGRTAAAVFSRRRHLGVRRDGDRPAAVLALHAEGLTDAQAAARLGLTESGFRFWRKRLGLPANGRTWGENHGLHSGQTGPSPCTLSPENAGPV